jgi:uncharacterized protein YabN with tetrapyrrole methylase and pyrophosphatase domain
VSPHHKPARKRRAKGRAKLHGRSRKSVRGRESGWDTFAGGADSAGEWFEKLVALQARLRAPGGCPWDREQTHESLRRFLVEETYEVLDAMESGTSREFASELGDLLLQVVFHSVLAEEAGRFMESAARRENRRLADLPRERMEELWNEAKAAKARDIPSGR